MKTLRAVKTQTEYKVNATVRQSRIVESERFILIYLVPEYRFGVGMAKQSLSLPTC